MVLTKNEIQDLLITALEGGSNYWYFLEDLLPINGQYKDLGLSTADRIFMCLAADKKMQLPVRLNDDPDEFLGYISYDNIKKADKLILTEDNKWILAQIKSGNWDAITADVWFQLVVMQDIVFG